jgi:three-Cys-motif partner protein
MFVYSVLEGMHMTRFGGPWSEAKLQCVEDYARAYLSVLQNQSWAELHYVDAFSGSGRQELKTLGASTICSTGIVDGLFDQDEDVFEVRRFLDGSAVRGLRVSATSTRGFDRHLFVDASQKSCGELQQRIAEQFPTLVGRSECVCADANAYLADYAASQDWSKVRSLVFLDPFDTSVSWATVQMLASTEACDVWYLFPLGFARMMPRSAAIPQAWSMRLDRLFGTHDWYDAFYETVVQDSLFGPEESVVRRASEERIVTYVVSRLESVFHGVSRPAILRNSRNSPLFALVMGIANPSPLALRNAKRIADYLTERLSRPT